MKICQNLSLCEHLFQLLNGSGRMSDNFLLSHCDISWCVGVGWTLRWNWWRWPAMGCQIHPSQAGRALQCWCKDPSILSPTLSFVYIPTEHAHQDLISQLAQWLFVMFKKELPHISRTKFAGNASCTEAFPWCNFVVTNTVSSGCWLSSAHLHHMCPT